MKKKMNIYKIIKSNLNCKARSYLGIEWVSINMYIEAEVWNYILKPMSYKVKTLIKEIKLKCLIKFYCNFMVNGLQRNSSLTKRNGY